MSILHFGIPSLDSLFGNREKAGLQLPENIDAPDNSSGNSISLCISGPDGTGKSILGLHLASRYAADHLAGPLAGQGEVQSKILYVSTDLKYPMASNVWRNFALDRPGRRIIPFHNKAEEEDLTIPLTPCSPLKEAKDGSKPLSHHLTRTDNRPEVYFVDLASTTVGDDWGFVNRILSAIEKPDENQPRHLVIIDSVEGFETLVGERDAFGLTRERRSRIAQIMRSAGDKCHILLIVEEPKENERLPEEFIADVVIRLRSVPVRAYVRRTIEIEKARGHAHVRGQHIYLIRDGAGSTTGHRNNPDDPPIENVFDGETRSADARTRASYQSYLHVCHSLHHAYRRVMTNVGRGRASEPSDAFAAFGIRYLDEMLEIGKENFKRQKGNDLRGLRCGTTTALIGNSETQKGPLGVAFLSRCFREYAEDFGEILGWLIDGKDFRSESERLATLKSRLPAHAGASLAERVSALREFLPLAGEDIDRMRAWSEADFSGSQPRHGEPAAERNSVLTTRLLRERREFLSDRASELQKAKFSSEWSDANTGRHLNVFYRMSNAKSVHTESTKHTGAYMEYGEAEWGHSGGEVAEAVKAAAWLLGPPHPDVDGIPVLVTTQDVHAQKLVRDFLPWLLRKVPQLKRYEDSGAITALRILMEEYTVCRRLEVHDLPSSVLIHILHRAIDEARNILHGEVKERTLRELARQSQSVRVVVDDFSILKDTYIEIREEPLLLRFLVFYLGQEGVTTLLIDTQPGRPDATVANSLHSELRSLVDNKIYTWRFPFYGEDRVAIAVIPPISEASPAVIRELRRGVRGAFGPEGLPLVVDPHFELYSGIEKGEPQPIAVQVWLYEETPAFKSYIDEENLRYTELFVPHLKKDQGGNCPVIHSVRGVDYDKLRDFCFLQRDTRLDHTLVFQVDEFWMMPTYPALRRAGTFRPQWKYFNAVTAEKKVEELEDDEVWRREWAADPFKLFQKSVFNARAACPEGGKVVEGDKQRRRYEFNYSGYETRLDAQVDEKLKRSSQEELRRLKESVERVPYMWDFGFLLCKVRSWEENDVELSFRKDKSDFKTTKEVWDALPRATKAGEEKAAPRPSWRVFLEACYQLGRRQAYSRLRPVTAFDICGTSSQTLSSLILEIWASEIYDNNPAARGRLVEKLTSRYWRVAPKSHGLIEWLGEYKRELFKTWLLLIEVMDFNAYAAAIKDGTILSNWESNPTAIATRHWYKTACHETENTSYDDPLVPVGLPGHFSMRGDWFLAVAGGSRSSRLADRALDLLNSRRANHSRLKKGLGLPTRKLDDLDMRTAILTLDFSSKENVDNRPRRISSVKYADLLRIGSNEDRREEEFHWLWRSGLNHYYRHTRIWSRWLEQMILWWDRMRYVERDNWVNGFERYDGLDGQTADSNWEELGAWHEFESHCNHVIKELMQANLESH